MDNKTSITQPDSQAFASYYLLGAVVNLSFTRKGQVQRGVQRLHGEGHCAHLPDQTTDENQVHLRWE